MGPSCSRIRLHKIGTVKILPRRVPSRLSSPPAKNIATPCRRGENRPSALPPPAERAPVRTVITHLQSLPPDPLSLQTKMGGANREGTRQLGCGPADTPNAVSYAAVPLGLFFSLTTLLRRRQGQAVEGGQEGQQGARRGRHGLSREEARRYAAHLPTYGALTTKRGRHADERLTSWQRKRHARKWRPRLAARAPSTPALRASRRAARNKWGAAAMATACAPAA